MRLTASLGASPQNIESTASEGRMQSPASGPGGAQTAPDYMKRLVEAWHSEKPQGIYSVCSAHPWVLEAAMEQALADNSPLLIEATSNQVNHLGGYTGITPADFPAAGRGDRTGDGLPGRATNSGRRPPRPQPVAAAACSRSNARGGADGRGFCASWVHQDPSGRKHALWRREGAADRRGDCRSRSNPVRGREKASGTIKPVYVIGTEVPVPGGATESLSHLEPTRREAAAKTLEVHRRVFAAKGLSATLPRVIALVVQPGVEFNHLSVVDYDPPPAAHLTQFLKQQSGLVYEAHSTDYQRPQSYRSLVRDGFIILKVGPALTFAMREALEALERIEAELIPAEKCSRLAEVMEQLMLQHPQNWEHHYTGDEQTQANPAALQLQ